LVTCHGIILLRYETANDIPSFKGAKVIVIVLAMTFREEAEGTSYEGPNEGLIQSLTKHHLGWWCPLLCQLNPCLELTSWLTIFH